MVDAAVESREHQVLRRDKRDGEMACSALERQHGFERAGIVKHDLRGADPLEQIERTADVERGAVAPLLVDGEGDYAAVREACEFVVAEQAGRGVCEIRYEYFRPIEFEAAPQGARDARTPSAPGIVTNDGEGAQGAVLFRRTPGPTIRKRRDSEAR